MAYNKHSKYVQDQLKRKKRKKIKRRRRIVLFFFLVLCGLSGYIAGNLYFNHVEKTVSSYSKILSPKANN